MNLNYLIKVPSLTCNRRKSPSLPNQGFNFKMYLQPSRDAIVRLRHLITYFSWDFYLTECSDQFQLTISNGGNGS